MRGAKRYTDRHARFVCNPQNEPDRKSFDMMSKLRRAFGLSLTGGMLTSCALLAPPPQSLSLAERLDTLPRDAMPLEEPVTIFWNDNLVPFIAADTDHDLAVTLGVVHAHLRLGQMEILRRIAQGRLAEIAGPVAVDIDKSLRILGFGRAAPDMMAMMPDETRQWVEAFVAGVNHYVANVDTLPHEFDIFAMDREPWHGNDLMAIGRLASTDVNWLIWFRLLAKLNAPDWPQRWRQLLAAGTRSIPSFGADASDELATLDAMLASVSRSGSNSVVISGANSVNGAAMIASDPHLGIFLPNLWLIAGYKSPSHHAAGLMIPGLPFVALGRNPHIAWGGTNMRSASSDLFDISSLSDDAIRTRTETIRTRWWLDSKVTIRETDYGPVITDAPLLNADAAELALRWTGHMASDEITAMLAANRARDWDQFVAAMDGFWVSGQNMLYADAQGHIGHVLATRLPRRPLTLPDDLALPLEAAAAWQDFATAATLPQAYDPENGILVSANNKPASAHIPVGYFFSPDDRVVRLTAILTNRRDLSLTDLKALQRDVVMPSALALRDALFARLDKLTVAAATEPDGRAVVARLRNWSGDYDADKPEPLLFEVFLDRFIAELDTNDTLNATTGVGRGRFSLVAHVAEITDDRLAAACDTALRAAAQMLETYPTWGDMHRLSLAHPLQFAPLLGGRYQFIDYPASGGSTTVMKTAHADAKKRHRTQYGSQARHVADLADPDSNYFALLGGQDGWFGSPAFVDQVPMWRKGDYVQVPLQMATVRATYKHVMRLTPRR